jgi:alcohol dehydrogenase
MSASTALSAAEPTALPETMVAARLHAMGQKLRLDTIPVPRPRPNDVLVEVKACGIVPNLRRVIANVFGTQMPDQKLFPPLPAIFGLDPAGVVAAVGEHVTAIRPGTRVYVNPGRSCGSCRMCRHGRTLDCPAFTFQGYFGRSLDLMTAYPYGGFAQYVTAPATSLVALPDAVSFEEAARLGYLGTAYSALKKVIGGPGDTVLINGISGVLGLCAALLALAMGAGRILGTGRDTALLERVRQLAPDRITVHSTRDEVTPANGDSDRFTAWVGANTDGAGLDAVVDCLPPGAPASALLRPIQALRRGGSAVNIGAVSEPLTVNPFWLVANRISQHGSVWFTTAEGEEIVAMAATGQLDLSPFQHRVSPLTDVNEALAALADNKDGGFANYVVKPGWLSGAPSDNAEK